jgi:hypothetical protein
MVFAILICIKFPKMESSNFAKIQTISYLFFMNNLEVIMKSEEIVMNQFCGKCNTEMEEFKTNIIISKGMFSSKRAYANVCAECGCIEFQIE